MMNRLILCSLIFIAFLSISCKKESDTPKTGEVINTLISGGNTQSFQRSIGGKVFFSHIRQTADGGYILVGWVEKENESHLHTPAVLKLNSKGETLILKKYPTELSEACSDFIQLANGELVIATSAFLKGNEASYGTTANLIRTDNKYNFLWKKKTGLDLDYPFSVSMCGTTDGGYLLASQYDWATTTHFVKLNNNGDRLWKKSYSPSRRVLEMIPQSNSKIMMTDEKNLIQMYSSSNIAWIKSYDSISAKIQSLKETGSKDIIIAGKEDYIQKGAFAQLVDENGIPIWKSSFTWLVELSYINTTAQNDFIVSGFIYTGIPGIQTSVLTRLNTVGETIWQKRYSEGTENYISEVHQTADGGFISLGIIYSNEGEPLTYIVKTDDSGN